MGKTDRVQLNFGDTPTQMFKSVNRAYRRGHLTSFGVLIPKRPFNNRKRTKGREMQVTKERIYNEIKI